MHAYAHGFSSFDGILLDLGFSSAHLQDASRGFSFLAQGPLDMRYDPSQDLTAETIVNTWSEDELARIFRVYGEELKARRFAKAIVKERAQHPLKTTTQLADVIEQEVGYRGKIHPATQVFQAIRIAVNDELGELERALPDLADLLKPGGRIAIISFHSLEDRIVKTFFHTCDQLVAITKKPVVATKTEIKQNPRARSAKLRVAEKK
jgi:16S rRNA (cytosine1402-N4)-methyltransferase